MVPDHVCERNKSAVPVNVVLSLLFSFKSPLIQLLIQIVRFFVADGLVTIHHGYCGNLSLVVTSVVM